jgi:hypothetical protein
MEALLGASKTYAIRLRRKGTTLNWDVSGATSIQLEVNLIGEPALAPIPFNPSAPGADFVNGRLVGTLGPTDVCARVGSYYCVITGVFSALEQPIAVGNIEVLPRPTSGPIPGPGGSYYNSTGILFGVNASATVPILQGTPVGLTPAGLMPATALAPSPNVLVATGIALVTIPPLQGGLYITSGSLLLPDWTAIIGTPAFTIGVPYYLSAVAGQLTTTFPTEPGSALLELVGQSEDGQTLDLQIGQYTINI